LRTFLQNHVTFLNFFTPTFTLYFTLPTTSPKQPEKLKWERETVSSKRQNRHDINSDKLDRNREITDVTVLGDNPLTSAIWGAGAWAGTKTKFKNCIWSSNNKIAPFYMHNNTSAENPTYIEFENCRFKSYNMGFGDCRLFLSTANNPNHAECYCTLIGTKVRTVYMSTEGSATTIDWKVTGFGNESNGTTITLDGYSTNVDLIGTASYTRYADGAY
jgi:hypothetical protein